MTSVIPVTIAVPATVGPVRRLVRHYPLVSFLVLAGALSWWAGALYLLGDSPVPIAGFGPFLAAVAVLGLTEGRGSTPPPPPPGPTSPAPCC